MPKLSFEEIIDDERYISKNKELSDCIVCDISGKYDEQRGKYIEGKFHPTKVVVRDIWAQIVFKPNDRFKNRFHFITDDSAYSGQFLKLEQAKRYAKKVFPNIRLKYKYYEPQYK